MSLPCGFLVQIAHASLLLSVNVAWLATHSRPSPRASLKKCHFLSVHFRLLPTLFRELFCDFSIASYQKLPYGRRMIIALRYITFSCSAMYCFGPSKLLLILQTSNPIYSSYFLTATFLLLYHGTNFCAFVAKHLRNTSFYL